MFTCLNEYVTTQLLKSREGWSDMEGVGGRREMMLLCLKSYIFEICPMSPKQCLRNADWLSMHYRNLI